MARSAPVSSKDSSASPDYRSVRKAGPVRFQHSAASGEDQVTKMEDEMLRLYHEALQMTNRYWLARTMSESGRVVQPLTGQQASLSSPERAVRRAQPQRARAKLCFATRLRGPLIPSETATRPFWDAAETNALNAMSWVSGPAAAWAREDQEAGAAALSSTRLHLIVQDEWRVMIGLSQTASPPPAALCEMKSSFASTQHPAPRSPGDRPAPGKNLFSRNPARAARLPKSPCTCIHTMAPALRPFNNTRALGHDSYAGIVLSRAFCLSCRSASVRGRSWSKVHRYLVPARFAREPFIAPPHPDRHLTSFKFAFGQSVGRTRPCKHTLPFHQDYEMHLPVKHESDPTASSRECDDALHPKIRIKKSHAICLKARSHGSKLRIRVKSCHCHAFHRRFVSRVSTSRAELHN
ncbi:uncharacterized protein MYCFIDRAFT_175513 [Pseudocercospora fijiensis CIRAD86]|uniref:Uncharacterized protein n=1 Tax=Pseudocercospora fijiensis (strain CIRAD86) TaxID=383855 RepID=M3AWU3_PSEFD|nr:uncharacterized protein MYCFIDRAFT_175513 [Pseudocercospora fijiensis CIRAD86]EME81937.1 hypothetical protein MYCFIDRAFT_175513 [Pseudocercospora fijiensis CIRAD86]